MPKRYGNWTQNVAASEETPWVTETTDEEDLNALTKAELMERARALGYYVSTAFTKAEILALIEGGPESMPTALVEEEQEVNDGSD